MQSDYADNPLTFDLDYMAGEFGATFRQFSLAVGTEIFEGSGVKGFTTPLATLHRFQGWADKFLATPPNGIEAQIRERRHHAQGRGFVRHPGSC